MHSRELTVAASTAVALVLVRSFVPVWYEGFDFDSDQAVVGLMAKHLAEFRHVPLFFYGQNYMLGVQAWLAAPLFAIGGPSVLLLRLPLVAINALVAVALIAMLARHLALKPRLAFVAVLPFVMPTPIVASHLVETLGASVEPFLYILILWALRDRPVPFGAFLAIGYLHREFTIFALPALLLVDAVEGRLLSSAERRKLAAIACAFLIVWIIVDLVKRQLHGAGPPPSGTIQTGPLLMQLQTLTGKMCVAPQALWPRFGSFFSDCLPDLIGTRTQRLTAYGMNSALRVGSASLRWILGPAALAIVLASAMPVARAVPALAGSRRAMAERVTRQSPMAFCWYLAIVGLLAVLAYPLSCEIVPGFPGILRYALLALFIPIAACAGFMAADRSPVLKAVVGAAFVMWATLNLSDNLRVVREYQTSPPPNKFRGLADYLVQHQIKYARGGYWDSYIVDFYSGERAIVASSDKVRITQYQQLVDEHRAEAVLLQRIPCKGGVRFKAWCIVGPPLP